MITYKPEKNICGSCAYYKIDIWDKDHGECENSESEFYCDKFEYHHIVCKKYIVESKKQGIIKKIKYAAADVNANEITTKIKYDNLRDFCNNFKIKIDKFTDLLKKEMDK